jgi:dipeptidyl aminopeptidase/acylaminoacyl peptidase
MAATWRRSASLVPYIWWGADDPSTIVVDIHGGPTGEAGLRWSASIARWRAQGFAVASVDYRGSTSYGRPHRRALNGGWAIRDVDDVAQVIADLTAQFPSARIVVAGNSAGGLTALRVATESAVWGAMVHYPVSDAATILGMSHEFEAGYNEILFGTSDAAQLHDRRIVVERLPRVLVTHGADDRVVPVAGTRAFVREATSRGVALTYVEIPDEGHGYRRAASLEQVAEAERRFLLDQ